MVSRCGFAVMRACACVPTMSMSNAHAQAAEHMLVDTKMEVALHRTENDRLKHTISRHASGAGGGGGAGGDGAVIDGADSGAGSGDGAGGQVTSKKGGRGKKAGRSSGGRKSLAMMLPNRYSYILGRINTYAQCNINIAIAQCMCHSCTQYNTVRCNLRLCMRTYNKLQIIDEQTGGKSRNRRRGDCS